MEMLFKQAVSIDGQLFKKGLNEVPKEFRRHEHFLKFQKAGLIVESDKPQTRMETSEERAQRLHQKFESEALVKKVKAEQAPVEDLDEIEETFEEPDDTSEDWEPSADTSEDENFEDAEEPDKDPEPKRKKAKKKGK